MNTKKFDIAMILSVSTGRLVSDMQGIYDIAEFLTDYSVWTHDLPRLAEPMRKELYRQHPKLVPWTAKIDTAISSSKNIGDTIDNLIREAITEFGGQLELTSDPETFRKTIRG